MGARVVQRFRKNEECKIKDFQGRCKASGYTVQNKNELMVRIHPMKDCKYSLFLIFTILICLLSSCSTYSPKIIRDLVMLRQGTTFYLDKETSDRELISPDFHKIIDSGYNKKYFSVWDQECPLYTKEQISEIFKKFEREPGYGENLLRHPPGWIKDLYDISNLDDYPNINMKGITIKNTNLRLLPTNKPLFTDPNRAAQGYPFDNLQNSALWANTPVYMSHITKDGAWILAESPFALGWIPVYDIAFVDKGFIDEWKTGDYIALIKDNVPIYDKDSVIRSLTHIGAIFPKINEDPNHFEFLIAVSNINREATIKTGRILKDYAVTKPLKATPRNIALVANEFMYQNYGWGGIYENRDCSAMIRDIFVPFGIWLPRNSSYQAKSSIFISLSALKPSDRERMILDNALPFMTLIWMRGHIMLYIGSHNARAMVLHNLWGIRVKGKKGKPGRRIVGHAVITTLQPGIELDDIDLPDGDLLNRIEGMTLLIPPLAFQKIIE